MNLLYASNNLYDPSSSNNFFFFFGWLKVYQPLGNINLEFGDSHTNYSSYGRELDLSTATVTVKYTIGDVEYIREHFSSNPHQVLVTKISSSKRGALSFTVFLDSKLHHHSSVNATNRIILEGSCPGKRMAPRVNTSEDPRGIQFSAILDLQIGGVGGKVQVIDDKKLKVESSDWAVLLLAASSSFSGPFTKPSDSKKDPTLASLNTLNTIKDVSFSKLLAHHLDDYQNLFNRVSLQLSKGSKAANESRTVAFHKQIDFRRGPDMSTQLAKDGVVSTAERVKSFKDDEDPSLVELLFNYGRYLLISSSRPGTLVANLQGIWNKDTEPAWEYVLSC